MLQVADTGARLPIGARGDISCVQLSYSQLQCAAVFERTLFRGRQKESKNMFSSFNMKMQTSYDESASAPESGHFL